MNRYLVHILLVLMIIEVNVMNGQNSTPSQQTVGTTGSTTGDPTEDINVTDSVTNSVTKPTTTGNSTGKRKGGFETLTETQWLLIVLIVIAILALVPMFCICKALYDCCQPQKQSNQRKTRLKAQVYSF